MKEKNTKNLNNVVSNSTGIDYYSDKMKEKIKNSKNKIKKYDNEIVNFFMISVISAGIFTLSVAGNIIFETSPVLADLFYFAWVGSFSLTFCGILSCINSYKNKKNANKNLVELEAELKCLEDSIKKGKEKEIVKSEVETKNIETQTIVPRSDTEILSRISDKPIHRVRKY